MNDGDLEGRLNKAIERAGLLNDPYGEVLRTLPEVLAAIRAAGQQRPAPLKPSQIRTALIPEVWRKMVVGAVVLIVIGLACGGPMGWFWRDHQIRVQCEAIYKPEACAEIMR